MLESKDEYVILNDKKSTDSFKDGGRPLAEVEDFDDIGWVVHYPWVIYDFDRERDSQVMYDIVQDLGLKCRIIKTTRGMHFYFKSKEEIKCTSHNMSPINIEFDVKSHSKPCYVKVKSDGKWREVLTDYPLEEIDEPPFWLIKKGDVPDFFSMKEGDGRNQELYNYIISLKRSGYTKEQSREIIELINGYVLGDPLPESEIETICRDEAFENLEIEDEVNEDDGKFSHVKLGKKLMEENNIICVNHTLYVYNDGVYEIAENKLKKRLNQLRYGITEKQRVEVLNYLRVEKVVDGDEIKPKVYEIALNNGVYNLKTGELKPFNSFDIVFNKLDVEYDNLAMCDAVDECLEDVFVGDEKLIQLFYEMMGACLIKKAVREKAFIFVGDGSNGKSTIIEMLQSFFKGNYSVLGLNELNQKFNVIELENKLVNFGDDIDHTTIRETSRIKKVIAGNTLYGERKGIQGHPFKPTATHIYSANSIPHSIDKSTGFYRRLIFIPFNATFTDKGGKFNANILDTVTTDEAKSYLLLQAIEGAKRLIKKGVFTNSASIEYLHEEYKIDNSSVLTWIDDEGLDKNYFLSRPRDLLFTLFTEYCKQSRIKNITGKKTFYKEVRKHFDFEEKPLLHNDNGKRYFVIKI